MNELSKKDNEFTCGEKQQEAFEILKQKLMEEPILGYSDYEKPFVLFTDASGTGLGAILSQKDEEGKEIVIAYASKSLTSEERNYVITVEDCLLIVWQAEDYNKNYS